MNGRAETFVRSDVSYTFFFNSNKTWPMLLNTQRELKLRKICVKNVMDHNCKSTVDLVGLCSCETYITDSSIGIHFCLVSSFVILSSFSIIFILDLVTYFLEVLLREGLSPVDCRFIPS